MLSSIYLEIKVNLLKSVILLIVKYLHKNKGKNTHLNIGIFHLND